MCEHRRMGKRAIRFGYAGKWYGFSLLECPGGEKGFQDRRVPAAQKAVDNQLEIGEKRGVRHVFLVELVLGRKDDRMIERVQKALGNAVQDRFFVCEGDGGGAGDSGTAGDI